MFKTKKTIDWGKKSLVIQQKIIDSCHSEGCKCLKGIEHATKKKKEKTRVGNKTNHVEITCNDNVFLYTFNFRSAIFFKCVCILRIALYGLRGNL